jgi:hypothetical protein
MPPDWESLSRAVAKARSFARAVVSLVRHGEVTVQTYALRRAECLECPAFAERERGVYCGACGCPEWFVSDLRFRNRLLGVKCPLNKW